MEKSFIKKVVCTANAYNHPMKSKSLSSLDTSVVVF